MTEFEARVLLNMVPGIGPVRAGRLITYFGGASRIFSAPAEELCSAGDFGRDIASEIKSAPSKYDAAAEIERAKKYGAQIITPADSRYPALLREIFDPPQLLYVYGEMLPEDENAVSVVGTRRPTDYGRMVAEHLCGDIAALGITIVSGLARGIDTSAHRAAVSAGGRTLAVLGSGLGIHFPQENAKLEEKIAHSGAVISEFPMGFPPGKGTFPRRNRIISGISLGTVVVEAPQKSGALITAMFALEQGKDVFAVPGSVMSKFSRGPHFLIKQGAKLIENAADVIDEIRRLRPLAAKQSSKIAVPHSGAAKAVQRNMNISNAINFSENEKKILELIENSSGGIDIDRIKNSTGASFGELSQLLVTLEIKGAVKPLPGKVYVRI